MTQWTPETWRSVPAFAGRVASEGDFTGGGAIFFQRASRVDALPMELPQPALLTTEGAVRAMLIVQAERGQRPEGPVDLFGAYAPDGARFVFTSAECKLVDESDPTWRRLGSKQ